MPINILFHASGTSPDAWLNALQADWDIAGLNVNLRVWQEGDTDPADYALVWKPPAAMLAQRQDLKAIFILGAGVDALLQLGDALPNSVPLIRLDDAGMGVQMAEYVTQAALRYYRRLDEYAQHQAQMRWRVLRPHKKADFSIGVMGAGVLGQCILDALRPFGFPLNCWSRQSKNLAGVRSFAGDEGLDDFLRASRVIVLILPLTKETTNLLDYRRLCLLPSGAYVINVARGAHIVDEDLLALVRSGHIAGATLDVFREEPLPSSHPFWGEEKIHITPHISALTMREESAQQIAGKIRAIENGTDPQKIVGLVDKTKGY